jgi:hypothetical protein
MLENIQDTFSTVAAIVAGIGISYSFRPLFNTLQKPHIRRTIGTENISKRPNTPIKPPTPKTPQMGR